MNCLEKFARLKNRYFALRHGRSEANEKSIINGLPETGIHRYGLVELGREQVRLSIKRAVDEGVLDKKIFILSSDFRRAVETAKITKEITEATMDIQTIKNLRERKFGNLEGKSNSGYLDVWAFDQSDPLHTQWNVESVDSVLTRTTGMIADLEDVFNGETFVLASHGDALQILATGFKKIPATNHRAMKHMDTGELRELILNPNIEAKRPNPVVLM